LAGKGDSGTALSRPPEPTVKLSIRHDPAADQAQRAIAQDPQHRDLVASGTGGDQEPAIRRDLQAPRPVSTAIMIPLQC